MNTKTKIDHYMALAAPKKVVKPAPKKASKQDDVPSQIEPAVRKKLVALFSRTSKELLGDGFVHDFWPNELKYRMRRDYELPNFYTGSVTIAFDASEGIYQFALTTSFQTSSQLLDTVQYQVKWNDPDPLAAMEKNWLELKKRWKQELKKATEAAERDED